MVEVRNVSDDCCCSYRGGCVEVDMWVCYVKWKKSEKGDGVGGVVLGEGGTALEGGGGKKCDLRPPLGARPASPPTRQAAQPPPRGSSTNPRPLA